jgi:2-methylisocitrate lyase-like PEP mutase family enzyme
MAYKKVFCSWNIDDYPHVLFTKEAVKAHENRLKRIFEEGTSYYWRTRMKTEKDLKKAIKKPYMK